jgi:6-phosphogluconolactonase
MCGGWPGRALFGALLLFAPSAAWARNFVYTQGAQSDSLSGFAIDPGTGTLVPLAGSPFSAPGSPFAVALHPSGRFLYHSASSSLIGSKLVDLSTGALTPLGAPVNTGSSGAVDIQIDPAGVFLYVVNTIPNTLSAFRIDAVSGALTPVAGSPFAAGAGPYSATIDPTGRFLYAGNTSGSGVSAFSIDRATGALSALPGSPFPTAATTRGVALDPAGRFLYAASGSDNTVSAFTIDASTGVLTTVPGSPYPSGVSPLLAAVDRAGRHLYVTNTASNNVSAFRIDGGSGALTPVAGSPFPCGERPVGIVVDLSGRFVYVANSNHNTLSAFVVDASGALVPAPGSPVPTGGFTPLRLATGRNFTRGDFSGDGRPDVLWRHSASGENVAWYMNGPVLLAGAFTDPPALADVRWRMVGTHDFNGDHETDVLWRHQTSGENVVWHMSGVDLATGTFLEPPALSDTAWRIAGTADFNGDHRPDLMWHHVGSGELVFWYMNGSVLSSGTFTSPPGLPDTSWRPAGVGDFNADAKPDVLWRNQVTGEMQAWFMDNSTRIGVAMMEWASSIDLGWTLSAIEDYDRDGQPDLVWRHGTSGQNAMWFMNGVVLRDGTMITTMPDTGWTIVGPR